MAIKAGLLVSNDSTRIRWDWEGGLIFPTNTYGNPVFKSETALTYAGRVMGGLLDPHKLRTRFTLPAYWGLSSLWITSGIS